jgi:hypothetical protein
VTELDLGEEPEYEDLEFVGTDGYRGESAETAAEPLKGRVRVGGPRGFRITEARVAGDEGLRRFIEEGSDRVDYYYVVLGLTFVTQDGPRLESAQVKLILSAVPEIPAPFVLSIRPSAEGTQEKVERGLKIGPKLSLPAVADAEIGDFQTKREYEQTRLFVRGLGLESATPGWEFTRESGKLLEGSCRLEVIVQAGRGAKLTVNGVATARATVGNLPWHFRASLPRPLSFSAEI